MYCVLRATTLDTNDDIHLQQCLNYSFIQFISDDSTRLSQNSSFQMNMKLEQNSWKSIPKAQQKQKSNTPCASFLFQSCYRAAISELHVSHVLHDHKVSHKATQNNYVLLFQLSFFIYSVKVSILPTLFSGQVKSWAACEAKGLNSKWTFIARSCALFFHPLTSCSVLCHVNV